jgi:hypothetical protein
VTVDADSANLDRLCALGSGQGQHLMGGGADGAPPGVGILFAWVWATPCSAARNRDRRASFCVDQERLDRGAPQVEGEERGANGSTHQVRRR